MLNIIAIMTSQGNTDEERMELMKIMKVSDDFFIRFGKLDDEAFSDSIIPKKYKELAMISISIVTKCEECIYFHVQHAKSLGCSREEIIEAIKMGMMASGSTSYPYGRKAFKYLKLQIL